MQFAPRNAFIKTVLSLVGIIFVLTFPFRLGVQKGKTASMNTQAPLMPAQIEANEIETPSITPRTTPSFPNRQKASGGGVLVYPANISAPSLALQPKEDWREKLRQGAKEELWMGEPRNNFSSQLNSNIYFLSAKGNIWTNVDVYYIPSQRYVFSVLGGDTRHYNSLTGQVYNGVKVVYFGSKGGSAATDFFDNGGKAIINAGGVPEIRNDIIERAWNTGIVDVWVEREVLEDSGYFCVWASDPALQRRRWSTYLN